MTTDQQAALIFELKSQVIEKAAKIQTDINNLNVLVSTIKVLENELNQKLCTTVKNAEQE